MSTKKEFLMTQDELNAMISKLEYLKNEKRREIAERISQAKGYGDLSENSEYDAAKTEQGENEGRIRELEEKVKYAKVIEVNTSVVGVGVTVKLLDYGLNKEINYLISGTGNCDPLNNKISEDSPLGKAIMGKREGDVVDIVAPAESYKVKILKIEKKKSRR